jgi:hypothetical protein
MASWASLTNNLEQSPPHVAQSRREKVPAIISFILPSIIIHPTYLFWRYEIILLVDSDSYHRFVAGSSLD